MHSSLKDGKKLMNLYENLLVIHSGLEFYKGFEWNKQITQFKIQQTERENVKSIKIFINRRMNPIKMEMSKNRLR